MTTPDYSHAKRTLHTKLAACPLCSSLSSDLRDGRWNDVFHKAGEQCPSPHRLTPKGND